jgi:hypothetical protein
MTKPQQLSLFNQPTLNISKEIKEAMNNDVRESGLSRELLVDRMNNAAERYGICLARGTGNRLTLETLEKWLNPSDLTRQMPLKAVPIFCVAVGKSTVIDVLAKPIGLRVIDDHDQKLLAWAEAKMAIKKHGRKIRKLEEEL